MITLKNIYKHYEKKTVRALNNISLDISRGETIALTGPSGCGKSTLLNIIGALDVPDSGSVLINSQPLGHYRPWSSYRSSMVGFIFQFHHLIPSLTLAENIELPMYPVKTSSSVRTKKVQSLLEFTGIDHRAGFYPAGVSGGERQRAAIARALVNDPLIILADEPTGSIDSKTGQKIVNLLVDICRQRNAILILATHNPLMAAMTDRTVSLCDGRLE